MTAQPQGRRTRQTKAWDELVKAVIDLQHWTGRQREAGSALHPEWVRHTLLPYLSAYCTSIGHTMSCRGYDPDLLDSELAKAAESILEALDPGRGTSEILSHISTRVRGAVLDAGRAQRKSTSNMGRNVARYERRFKTLVASAESRGGALTEAEKDDLCERVVPATSLDSTRMAVRYGAPPEQVMPEYFGLLGHTGDEEALDPDTVSAIHKKLLSCPDGELRLALVDYMAGESALPKWPDLGERLEQMRNAFGVTRSGLLFS